MGKPQSTDRSGRPTVTNQHVSRYWNPPTLKSNLMVIGRPISPRISLLHSLICILILLILVYKEVRPTKIDNTAKAVGHIQPDRICFASIHPKIPRRGAAEVCGVQGQRQRGVYRVCTEEFTESSSGTPLAPQHTTIKASGSVACTVYVRRNSPKAGGQRRAPWREGTSQHLECAPRRDIDLITLAGAGHSPLYWPHLQTFIYNTNMLLLPAPLFYWPHLQTLIYNTNMLLLPAPLYSPHLQTLIYNTNMLLLPAPLFYWPHLQTLIYNTNMLLLPAPLFYWPHLQTFIYNTNMLLLPAPLYWPHLQTFIYNTNISRIEEGRADWCHKARYVRSTSRQEQQEQEQDIAPPHLPTVHVLSNNEKHQNLCNVIKIQQSVVSNAGKPSSLQYTKSECGLAVHVGDRENGDYSALHRAFSPSAARLIGTRPRACKLYTDCITTPHSRPGSSVTIKSQGRTC
ncbi:hypothetical protein J6590_044901 [Homalodisca vitripennis]|nr:hypothetical protein J6590_044901 [Homalodisca vitripennis]